MATKTRSGKTQKVEPQKVRWTSSLHANGAGILIWADSLDDVREQEWMSWQDLHEELKQNLLPSIFANPTGYSFVTRDHNGKKEWLVQIVDDDGESCAQVWFGVNPDEGWSDDGMVHIGNSTKKPSVWQSYRRLSNGTYERLPSQYSDLDTVPSELKKITVGV